MQLLDAGQQIASRPTPNALVSPGWANNAPALSPATIADPDTINAIMAELMAFLTLSGQAANKSNVNQVATAALMLFGAYGADSGGTVNAYVVAPPLPLSTLQDGQRVLFYTTRTNTGAATLQLSPLSAKAIQYATGAALGPGAIQAGFNEVFWSAGAGAFVIAKSAALLAGEGYAVSPSGVVWQWGGATASLSSGYGQLIVNFPIAFPNACLQVVATANGVFEGVASGFVGFACSNLNPGNFLLTAAQPSGVGAVGGCLYIAVGF